jgi:hypothetical protein
MSAEGKILEIIAPLFARPKGRGVESGLCRAWKNTKMSARALYYNPEKPSASQQWTSSPQRYLRKTSPTSEPYLNTKTYIQCIGLSGRDSYAIPHGLMGVWFIGYAVPRKIQWYVQIHSVFNQCFLEISNQVPAKTKSGPAITSAFRSLFHDNDSRRPLWVRTDKGKEFLNKHFQDILRDEGIHFQVCRNPDVKCAVVESAHRTIRDRHLKFLTSSNTYRYIDVLPKFVKAYNDTVHTKTSMVPSRVTDANVLAIWRRMEVRRQRVRVATTKFRVAQHVRISKEKIMFDKAAEHNFSTEIFRIVKVIHRWPRVVYELEDLNGTLIDGQFYQEELTRVRITSRTTYRIDKIMDKGVRRGIRKDLVR